VKPRRHDSTAHPSSRLSAFTMHLRPFRIVVNSFVSPSSSPHNHLLHRTCLGKVFFEILSSRLLSLNGRAVPSCYLPIAQTRLRLPRKPLNPSSPKLSQLSPRQDLQLLEAPSSQVSVTLLPPAIRWDTITIAIPRRGGSTEKKGRPSWFPRRRHPTPTRRPLQTLPSLPPSSPPMRSPTIQNVLTRSRGQAARTARLAK
jgi:hypothetical protein